MQKALGIDIGGTKILYSVLDKDGNILSEIKKNIHTKNSGRDCFRIKINYKRTL